MKKFILLLLFIFIVLIQAPVFAVKVKDEISWGIAAPAKVTMIEHSLEIIATVGRMHTAYYVANLDCNEFSRVYKLKSSLGKTYLRPRARTVRISREPTVILKNLFKENSGNVFFKPYGFGLHGNYVGEFFIGDMSVSEYLIQKGICKYVN